MHDSFDVQVLNGEQHLFEQIARVVFIKLLIFDYSVKKLASWAGFHDNVNVLAINECLMELNDVWMV